MIRIAHRRPIRFCRRRCFLLHHTTILSRSPARIFPNETHSSATGRSMQARPDIPLTPSYWTAEVP